MYPGTQPFLSTLNAKLIYTLGCFLSACILQVAQAETIKIKDYSGAVVAELETSDQNPSLSYREREKTIRLTARRQGGKYTYFDAFGEEVAKIKTKGSGFKLYGKNPEVVFKIKSDSTRVKVVINGDEEHPIKIKSKGDKHKVYRVHQSQQTSMGQVRLTTDKGGVKVKDSSGSERFRIKTSHLSSAYGLLLDDRIQKKYRYILVMEILLRQGIPSIQ